MTRDGAGCSNAGDEEIGETRGRPDDNAGNSETRDLDAERVAAELIG